MLNKLHSLNIRFLGLVHANEKKSSEKSTKPDIFESHILLKKNIAIHPLCSRQNVGYFLRERVFRQI